MDPLISLRNVSVEYSRKRDGPLTILQDLSLDVYPSEFLCVLGPSGCGKSTLLNLLAGFLKPSRGSIQFARSRGSGPSAQRLLIFQDAGVFPWLTVAGNIGFGLSQLPEARRIETIDRYLSEFGLDGFGSAYPHQISGGMRQRVAIARALATAPEVIYMDEPFAALDYFTRLKMRSELIKIWQKQRMTVVFVTHDVDEAIQLGDRILTLSARPARLEQIIPVDLEHPRSLDDIRLTKIRNAIFEQMHLTHAV